MANFITSIFNGIARSLFCLCVCNLVVRHNLPRSGLGTTPLCVTSGTFERARAPC